MHAPMPSSSVPPPSSTDRGNSTVESSHATLPPTHVATDLRGTALAVLATLAVIFALNWAQSFVVPLILGIVFAYTLNPLVTRLEWLRIPRVAGATLVMIAVVSLLGLGGYALRGEIQTIVDQLPATANKLSEAVAELHRAPGGAIQNVQKAAKSLESVATGTTAAPDPRATHVVVDAPILRFTAALWSGSMGALGFMGHAVMVMFLVFFLLVAGDTFKRKLVHLTGPPMSRKKITVHILDDINSSIQRYMVMMLVTNLLVALLNWVVFRIIGLDNAGAWAATSGVLHLIPYVGPAITAAATGMAALLQFNSLATALLVAGASVAVAIVVGVFVTTWMTGRIARMNPAAVFISLLFWGWLWGAWGMLLSIPIIVIVKVVAHHIERLHPLAELLGE